MKVRLTDTIARGIGPIFTMLQVVTFFAMLKLIVFLLVLDLRACA